MNGNGRVDRLRMIILVLVFLLVFVGIVAPISIVAYVQQENREVALRITCTTIEANIAELHAVKRNGQVLDEIAHDLGLPVEPRPLLEIPEVPVECAEVS